MNDWLQENALVIHAVCMVIAAFTAAQAAYEGSLGIMAYDLAVYAFNAVALFRQCHKRGVFA